MDYLSQVPLTAAFGAGGVTAGTTTTTSVAAAVPFAIKGRMYSKAIAANGATPTTDAVTGAAFTPVGLNKACIFVICLDASGALKIVQGQTVGYSDAGVYETAPQFPAIPDNLCPIALEAVKVISTGSAWTMGVSNQAAQTGITKTFADICTLPDRPVTL